jgi:hypothetical protein
MKNRAPKQLHFFTAFVIMFSSALIAGQDPNTARDQSLIRIMEVVDGVAAEAIPLAKAELRILDARFKGDKYNALLAWLNTPAELTSGLPESTGKEFPGLVENHEEELVGATVFEAINPLRGVDGVLLAEAARRLDA